MPTIAQQLQQLQTDKETLVTKLTEKGVTASNDETFTTLCPKVGDIQSGGGDVSEYFTETISSGDSTEGGWLKTLKTLPNFIITGTSAFYMFAKCPVLEFDLSNFDTSNVTTMYNMFQNCKNIVNLDLSNFNTTNVTNMQEMFYNCNKLTSLNVSSFNTSKVSTMYYMFGLCNKLTNLDLSNFDTSNVTTMQQMFYNNSGLTSVNISSFTSSRLSNNTNMFGGCTNLVKLIIDNQNLFRITNVNAFSNSAIANGTGYVYVPDDMVETYKSATNWSTYASQIKGISELPVEE